MFIINWLSCHKMEIKLKVFFLKKKTNRLHSIILDQFQHFPSIFYGYNSSQFLGKKKPKISIKSKGASLPKCNSSSTNSNSTSIGATSTIQKQQQHKQDPNKHQLELQIPEKTRLRFEKKKNWVTRHRAFWRARRECRYRRRRPPSSSFPNPSHSLGCVSRYEW